MIKQNLLQLYTEAFGSAYSPVGTVAFFPGTKKQDASKFDDLTLNFTETSIMGTDIHFPCKFDGYPLPNEPLINIVAKNRIVKTHIDGSNGSFKELFSLDDYEITIKGIAINEQDPDKYPFEIVRKLREFHNKAFVEVTSQLLSVFNIKYLAIEKMNLPTVPGMMAQPFIFKCLSDNPFQLDI